MNTETVQKQRGRVTTNDKGSKVQNGDVVIIKSKRIDISSDKWNILLFGEK